LIPRDAHLCFSAEVGPLGDPKGLEIGPPRISSGNVGPVSRGMAERSLRVPADKVTLVQKDGKTYYVFPDAANNQAYVGGPTQYQAYKQLHLANKLTNENLEAAEMNQDASMDWGAWGGWGGPVWRGLR
jgi:hypothetical protein